MNKPQIPQSPYSYEQLNSVIIGYEAITGERPESLNVTPQFYTWFIQECAKDVDNLKKFRGIDAKLPTPPEHLGVLIIKKPKIHK